jgi:hypothetical protein
VWTAWDDAGSLVCEGEWEEGQLSSPLRLSDPGGRLLAPAVAEEKARVDGKYADLIVRIPAPQDLERYGEFHDFGHYGETDYLGEKRIPAGYWVYVHPHCFVWRLQVARTRADEPAIDRIREAVDAVREK